MMISTRPTFAVVTPADADARRFVDLATIRSLSGIPSTGTDAMDDTALGAMLDGVLAACARSCRLAAYRAVPITLAQEVVRATWTSQCWPWQSPSTLFLPWRAPITAITITEGATELDEDVDFSVVGAGIVERINGCWSTSAALVVDYTAGWLADDDENAVPADIVSLIADQVRMNVDRQSIDLNLRQEDIPGVWSGSFNIPGGDAIDTCGLMMPLYEALNDFRAPPSV